MTVRVPGLTDLVIAGPNNEDISYRDSSEPYSWIPGNDYADGSITYTDTDGNAAGLQRWVQDFLVAHGADASIRATLFLYDGS